MNEINVTDANAVEGGPSAKQLLHRNSSTVDLSRAAQKLLLRVSTYLSLYIMIYDIIIIIIVCLLLEWTLLFPRATSMLHAKGLQKACSWKQLN